MRICLLAATLAGCVNFGPSAALAQARPMPVVTVLGEASVAVQPDTAIIGAGVTSQAKTAREASEANARAMAPVLAALKDAGVADADIQTSRISLQPVHDPSKGGSARIAAFQAGNQVTVRLHDVRKVTDVIDRLVGAGANTLSGVEFLLADPSKALDQARSAGIADARHKAELYAKAAGAALGHAVAIDEQTTPPGFVRQGAPTVVAGAATPIAVGEETLKLTITVTYELLY
jgi:uncharacterized protein YggE